MNENKTAQLLIKLRKENNMTQNDLAEKLNVSYQAVSKWERGENLPDANLMLEIAKLYKITVDEILRGELLPKDDLKLREKKRNIIMITGIAIIIISVIPFMLLLNINLFLGLGLLIGIAVIGVVLVVISSLSPKEEKTAEDPKFKKIENIVYPICFVIFFVLGIRYGLWYISWVVFVLGYAVTMIFKKV